MDDGGHNNCTNANCYYSDDYVSGDSDDIINRGKFVILFLNKWVYKYDMFN